MVKNSDSRSDKKDSADQITTMIGGEEVIIEFVSGEEAAEIEKFVENRRLMKEQRAREKKERRAEINRKIAEQKRNKKRDKEQLSFFNDNQ